MDTYQLLTSGYFPDAHPAVEAPRQQALSIWRKADIGEVTGAAVQFALFFFGFEIPQTDRRIPTSRRRTLGLVTVGDRQHIFRVANQFANLLARLQIPYQDSPFKIAGK